MFPGGECARKSQTASDTVERWRETKRGEDPRPQNQREDGTDLQWWDGYFKLCLKRYNQCSKLHQCVCLFVSAPASSAPSAPSLGGSLSAGSHSGGADPEQAWPQSSGEEDLQLQLALAMSKEEAEQVTQSSLFKDATARLLLSKKKEKHNNK